MDLFSVFDLCGGIAFFLYGMTVLSGGLTKVAGGKLEQVLRKLTSNPVKGVALGAGITVALQSSTALTVMLVGLVNSGMLGLRQAISIIMGSNIGTTLTAWLLSLAGIQSKSFFVRLLKPESFAPLVALAGIILIMGSKAPRRRDFGNILVGFAVLMFGMTTMTEAVQPLKDMPGFTELLTAFSNPALGVLTGAVVTILIQSSAVSVGILQAISATGGITVGMAMPIIMGQNIGTCLTALLSGLGANRDAKRVGIVHVYFNSIGTLVFLVLFYGFDFIFGLPFLHEPISSVGVAIVHSAFNIGTTLLLLPFAWLLEKLACLTIKDDETSEEFSLLDDRLLLQPSFAAEHCKTVTQRMALLAKETMLLALDTFEHYDTAKAELVYKNEDGIDRYEDKLGTYLVKISSESLSLADSRKISMLLQNIGDFERIGDHAVNVVASAQEMHDKGVFFSPSARAEVAVLFEAVREILSTAFDAFDREDLQKARVVEPLEQVVDELNLQLKSRHISRLREGACTLELGFILSDLQTNLERVSDHCSNIAVCLIEVAEGGFDTHEYISKLRESDNEEFTSLVKEYQSKYILP